MNGFGVSRQRTHLVRLSAATLFAAAAALVISPAQAQTKLQFWDMIWGPPEYIETAEKIVSQFNAEHPDIQVEYRSVPWNNWYQTFVTAVSSGSAPDLSTGAGYQAVQLYELDAIRPIDGLVEKMRAEGDLDDFAPGTVDTLRFDDHYVALPWGLDVRVWFYRPSLLEAAGVAVPTTWEEFRAAAKTLTHDNQYGVVASGDTGGTHYVFASILNNGGGLFDAERNLTLTSNERNVEAVQWLSDLVKDGSMSPASAGYSSDDRRAAFLRGDAAFALDGPGLYKSAGDVADDIAIMPPMKGPHGDVGTIFWVNNVMMYQQSQHPEEAEVFLQWWSKNQLPLWTEGRTGQIPARNSFVSAAAGNDARYQYIIDNYIPMGKTTANAAEGIFPELSEIEGEGVMQTLTQQLFQGVDPAQALAQAEARMKEILE